MLGPLEVRTDDDSGIVFDVGGVTAVRSHQRGENPYRGRLSRAVRAQEAEHRAGAHGQIDPVECDGILEPLDQPFGKYGVSHVPTLPTRPDIPGRSH